MKNVVNHFELIIILTMDKILELNKDCNTLTNNESFVQNISQISITSLSSFLKIIKLNGTRLQTGQDSHL